MKHGTVAGRTSKLGFVSAVKLQCLEGKATTNVERMLRANQAECYGYEKWNTGDKEIMGRKRRVDKSLASIGY